MKHYTLGATSVRACLAGLMASLLAAAMVACGGGGVTPNTGVQIRPLSAEFSSRKAISYSPYRTSADSSGLNAEVIPLANIEQDLRLLLASGYKLIRLFGSSDKVAAQTLQVIRANNFDIKVQLGLYVGGDTYAATAAAKAQIYANDEAEIARGIALANQYPDIVLAVSVGNETQVDFSGIRTNVDTLAGYLHRVRNAISQPVTTDDNYLAWSTLSNTIINEVDYASIHTYAELDTVFSPNLWDWKQKSASEATRAVAMMDAAIAETRRQYAVARAYLDSKGLTNMPITVGETGWNAVDLGKLPFRAHPVNQKMYIDRLATWATEGRTGAGPKAVIYFEAFDEPWKQGDDGWGMFDKDRKARYAIQALGTCGTTWTCASGSYTAASAVYFVPPVVNTPVAENKYTIYSDAALGASELRATGLRFDPFDGNSVNAPESTAAPTSGDGTSYIDITPQPKVYGWGFLNQSSTTPATTANLSGFSGGTVRFSVRTTYPGKIEIGISSDNADREIQEAYLQIGNGDYGYCNTGAWCTVSIPLSAFQAANPKLDISLVMSRFIIADRYSFTGKAQGANITTKIAIDAIYWSR
jgi:exo-beta-1,3-glucanase (GH17 family)